MVQLLYSGWQNLSKEGSTIQFCPRLTLGWVYHGLTHVKIVLPPRVLYIDLTPPPQFLMLHLEIAEKVDRRAGICHFLASTPLNSATHMARARG